MTPEAKAQHFILQLLKEGIIDARYCYREGHGRVENSTDERVKADDVMAYGRYEAYTVIIDAIDETQSIIKKNGEYKNVKKETDGR